MKIQVDMTVNDLVTAHKVDPNATNSLLHLKLIQSIGGPIFILFIIYTLYSDQAIILIISFILCLFLGIYLWLKSPGILLSSTYEQKLDSGVFDNLLGKRSYEILNDGLEIKTNSGIDLIFWESIDKLIFHSGSYFILLKGIGVIAISKSSLIEGDYDSFIKEMKKRITSGKNDN